MPNPELGQIVRQQVKAIVAESGAHLDFAGTIQRLRKEHVGREIEARIRLEHDRALLLSVGIVLPVKADNTMHAILLANNRALFVGAPSDLEGLKKYKIYMSPGPDKGALYWVLNSSQDLSVIEESFQGSTMNFPATVLKTMAGDEDPKAINWAVTTAREIKNRS